MKNVLFSDSPQREVYSLVHNNHEKEKYSGFENSNAGPWFYYMYFCLAST